ncbi:MAG: DUF115 domain-containing protein [Treponema sp.]|jgi:hypothetical protein|nr:DUF115 domain-containing protein [Treponema sp.]
MPPAGFRPDPAGGDAPQKVAARRGFSVSYRGISLLSRIDPPAQGERLAGGVKKAERTLYFCPSPLLGYGLPELLERLGKDSAVLCVEGDEKLLALAAEEMGGLLSPGEGFRRLALVRAPDGASLCAAVREIWGARRFRRVEAIRLTGGWRLMRGYYDSLEAALRREIALDWSNAMTLIRLGRLYARNLARNLSLLNRGGDAAALDFGAAPVLVLGAGPSLDGVLKELASRFRDIPPGKRPFRIICVDTALPCLRDWGIRPDLVVALESQHWNLRDFVGAGAGELPLAMDFSALNASSRVLKGKLWLFSTPWTRLNLLDRLEKGGFLPLRLPPLGSVGLSAVSLALKAAGGPVITGGIDFSFTLDKYHARSSPGHLEWLEKHTRFSGVLNLPAFRKGAASLPSKNGEPVLSDPGLRSYRDLFEMEFGGPGGEGRLRDIAGSGLPLGIPVISTGEALALLEGSGPEAAGGTTPEPPSPAALPRGSPPVRGGQEGPARPGLGAFICGEEEALEELRGMLAGEAPPRRDRLEYLLDYCDYLWAHFPECAGAGGRRPPGDDLSFLKRVRAEIDPFRKLFRLSLKELGS